MSAEAAELGHEGEQGCGGGGAADAGDGLQGMGGCGKRRMGLDEGCDGGVDGLDLVGEAVEQALQVGLGGVGAWGGDAVGAGGALLDEVAPGEHERLELVAGQVWRLPSRELAVALLAVAGQGAGVDGVGFAEDAERADERLDAAGVGAVGGTPASSMAWSRAAS
jgi:hypothetical protein